MIRVSDLEIGDIIKYEDGISVIFLGEDSEKVILEDDVLGEIKVLKTIFEQNYSPL